MALKAIVFLVGGLLILASISDFRKMRIPNWIPVSIFALFLLYLVMQGFSPPVGYSISVLSSLAVGGGTFAVFAVLFALNLIGGGDVKLIGAMSFWAGPDYILGFLLITAFSGGVLALVYYLIRPGFLKKTATPENRLKEPDNRQKSGKTNKSEEKINKKERKSHYLPYGIAISLGGLFVVNNILTNLLA